MISALTFWKKYTGNKLIHDTQNNTLFLYFLRILKNYVENNSSVFWKILPIIHFPVFLCNHKYIKPKIL